MSQIDTAIFADLGEIVGVSNELAMDGAGWQVIPYGSWPHSMGVQQFGRAEAETMVGYFKQTWNRIKRAVTGLPVFNGHPDLPSMANQYPDKAEYGQIADMEVRPDGLAVKMVLSAMGAKLIEKGKKYISPHWLANAVGKTEDGRPIYSPVFMKSIGLTDNPNIPNPTSLLNSAASADESAKKNKMKDALIKLLGLANEANESQIEDRVADLLKRPEPAALVNEQTARNAAEGQATQLGNELKTAKAELETVKVALANERSARIDELISTAIRTGKILEAEKAVWQKRLSRDFAEESVAIVNEKQKIKTEALTAGKAFEEAAAKLANTGGEPDADDAVGNSAKMNACVNDFKAKIKAANPSMSAAALHNQAWASAKKAQPKLFGAK